MANILHASSGQEGYKKPKLHCKDPTFECLYRHKHFLYIYALMANSFFFRFCFNLVDVCYNNKFCNICLIIYIKSLSDSQNNIMDNITCIYLDPEGLGCSRLGISLILINLIIHVSDATAATTCTFLNFIYSIQ